MSIDASFYKNVFFLMQVVPPSFECTKHFKQGMFEKPNPAGFIHISHYLLSIYNPKKFQKVIPWPILNKMDETQYRLKVKEYLDIIATENPDINFPSILMIHIMRAAGTRFLIVMWKLSQISLRSYIARHYNSALLLAPDAGATCNISRTHITNINLERYSTISELFEEIKLATKNFEQYMQYYSNTLKNIQTAIFETTENIRKYIQVAPVSQTVSNRLADPKDTEIINLWKANIYANIEHLHYTNSYLSNLKSPSNKIVSTVSSSYTDPETLNANNLPEIDAEAIQQVFNNNTKHLDSGLYRNGCLVFYSLLLMFDKILKQTKCRLQIDNLSNLLNCGVTITGHNKIIKSMKEVFQNFILATAEASHELQSGLQNKTFHCTIQNDFFYSMCQKILCEAPKLELCFSESTDNEQLVIKNKLHMSPEKGKYKHLFARYKKNKSLKSPLPSSSFTNCSESKPIDWMSPKRLSLSCKKSSPSTNKKVSPRYSKLFSPRSLSKYYTGNCTASSPTRHGEKSPKSNHQSKESNTIHLEIALKNIYDLSNRITEIAASLSK